MLGYGFVGVSTIARQYMREAVADDPRSAVVAVMSSSLERAETFAREHDVPSAYGALEDLLSDPSVDVVYISTTNEHHCDQTLAAAAAGKHVLCEKPLALSVDDARRMQDACADAGVVLGTNHHLRHAPTIRAMRRVIDEGAIGTPLAARVFHAVLLPARLQTWRVHSREGGGATLDITVHDTDTLRYLLDDDIVEVTAFGANHGMASEGLFDGVMGVMRFAGGAIASFHDGFTIPHAGTGLEVHGTDGSLIGRDVMTQNPVGEVHLRRGEQSEPVDVGPRESLYVRAVRQFNDAVVNRGTPAASAADGMASLAVAVAVTESAATGRAVRVAELLEVDVQ
jgi:1,5-anhydro-D-fructose reductase (1,5-anhydro-D-mannitol-forming)